MEKLKEYLNRLVVFLGHRFRYDAKAFGMIPIIGKRVQKQLYMNRILPVIGNHLRSRKIAFFNLELTHVIAENFARCGVNKLILFDSSKVAAGSQFGRSFGARYASMKTGRALEQIVRQHNEFEDEWRIVNARKDGEARTIRAEMADMIVAGGTVKECRKAIKIARELGIPAIVFAFFPRQYAKSLISVVDCEADNSLFDEELPETEPAEIDRLDFLETADLAGNLAKAVLLRGTEFQRQDIEELVYRQKRNNIIRGTSDWPWYVFYGSERSKEKMLEMISRESCWAPEPAAKSKIIIIGCGTGSLIANEALNFCKEILLVDCKRISIFNPVRQAFSTSQIGKSKVFGLQEILAGRIKGTRRVENSFARTITKGEYKISASELKLKGESAGELGALISWFKPDVVIVAMGQTRDDNFVATKILYERKIAHVVPVCFPLATAYKHIAIDNGKGPCYSCLQGTLSVDAEGGPELTDEQRDMFYGEGSVEEGTQPATIFETRPSAHSCLRLAVQLGAGKRQRWLSDCLAKEQQVFVGANISIETEDGHLYGVRYPGQMVVYSTAEMVGVNKLARCIDCGREYEVKFQIE